MVVVIVVGLLANMLSPAKKEWLLSFLLQASIFYD